jgi:hypothetical protein
VPAKRQPRRGIAGIEIDASMVRPYNIQTVQMGLNSRRARLGEDFGVAMPGNPAEEAVVYLPVFNRPRVREILTE